MEMEFFLYFSTESKAEQAKKEILKVYPQAVIEIRNAAEGDQILCLTRFTVNGGAPSALDEIDARLENISHQFGGDYDGYGTSLEANISE